MHHNRTYYYTDLAVSSPLVVEIIASIHCTSPQRDGQAELTSVAIRGVYSYLTSTTISPEYNVCIFANLFSSDEVFSFPYSSGLGSLRLNLLRSHPN